MNDDNDRAIIGKRSTDGDWLSVREAYKMFATKEELAGMHTALNSMVTRVDALPVRAEHELHWEQDRERWERSSQDQRALVEKIDGIAIPKWVLPVLGLVMPIIFFFLSKLSQGVHP